MKRSVLPTEYVLVRALSQYSVTPCHFVLLHLSAKWRLKMTARLQMAALFEDDKAFFGLSYLDAPLGFYACNEDCETGVLLQGLFEEHLSWAFVLLDDPRERIKWNIQKGWLDRHTMMINAEGSASYACCARDTQEEYGTEAFSLKEVLGE